MKRRAMALSLAALALPAQAQTQPPAKPFATQHLLLQLSDDAMPKQKLVISVANSILKDFGPDNVAIEVVAFGPGVKLLYADSPERVAVDSLMAQGVRFDVCMNTINTITRDTGHRPALNPGAVPVPYGVGKIMELVEQGYVLERP
jgi:intracellular sulfur oxidation DsrE/DsrF family protein